VHATFLAAASLRRRGRACSNRRSVVDPGRRQFSLQARGPFGTFENVRIVFAIATLSIAASSAFAQEQEGKLIDRLLKPNLALENSAQNKKFANTGTTVFDKPARTHSFPQIQTNAIKPWTGDRALRPQQFAARHFRAGDSIANISARSQLTKNDTVFTTPAAIAGTRVAPASSETAAVREYAGIRPFLGKGKSQKALEAQNKPLTIEQVRELLNKSK
jgi:hypothetical protein